MDRILVIDHDPEFRQMLQSTLPRFGFQVVAAERLADALEIAQESSFHLILTAVELADADAKGVIRWAEREQPAAAVVVVTSARSEHCQRAAMLGSDGVLFRSPVAERYLHDTLAAALQRRRDAHAQRWKCRYSADLHPLKAILHPADPRGEALAGELRAAAASSSPLLLTGERGSMFELMAYMIHQQSRSGKGLFLSVVAGSGVALFGCEEPEFEMGPVELAHGGTLFLSDAGHLSPRHSEQLVRFAQTGTFVRSGGKRQVLAHVRLILALDDAPTDRLPPLLAGRRIEIPPLRARPGDIVPLAEELLSAAAIHRGAKKPELEASVADALMEYAWPANLEELKAVMERTALLCDQRVTLDDLRCDLAARAETSWREIERKAIEEALRANAGNRTKAAKQLGMSIRKLQYRLREYGVGPLRNQD